MKDDTLARLKSFPNLVITPHLGFYTDEAVSNMVEITLMNLQEFELKGTCKNQRVCK